MGKRFLFSAIVFFCSALSNFARASFYDEIMNFLPNNPDGLQECDCLPGLKRECGNLDLSLRGVLDQKASEFLLTHGNFEDGKPILFFFGSGRLLNELTLISSFLSMHLDPTVFLIDHLYSFENLNSPDEKLFENYCSLIAKQEEKYQQKVETHLYETLHEALEVFLQKPKSITAFFCIDIYYPINSAQKKMKEKIERAIAFSSNPRFSSDLLFFFLNRARPKTDSVLTRSEIAYNAAVLDIYKARIVEGELEYQELLYRKLE